MDRVCDRALLLVPYCRMPDWEARLSAGLPPRETHVATDPIVTASIVLNSNLGSNPSKMVYGLPTLVV